MSNAVALLRGVNVGGHNLIGMEVLRALCTSIGLEDPRTLLQSGNVVFSTKARTLAAIGERLSAAIEAQCGFHPSIAVRSAAELEAAVKAQPFDLAGKNPSYAVVFFPAGQADKAAMARVEALSTAVEPVRAGTRELYAYYSAGQAKTRLTAVAVERALGVPVTARNWNTVTKLLEMVRTAR